MPAILAIVLLGAWGCLLLFKKYKKMERLQENIPPETLLDYLHHRKWLTANEVRELVEESLEYDDGVPLAYIYTCLDQLLEEGAVEFELDKVPSAGYSITIKRWRKTI